MIVGGKECFGTEVFLVADVLDDGPGDREAIVGGRSSSDFVQDQQGVPGRVAKDVGHFVHLDHKGTLSAPQVVGGADAGKDPVDDAQIRGGSRHKASDLRHQADQGHLAHVGGLTGHVGPGDDRDRVLLTVERRVVGDKVTGEHLLDDRMAAVLDADDALTVDLGAHIAVSLRRQGQGAQNVQHRQRSRGFLDAHDLPADRVADLAEAVVFQRIELVVGVEDHILEGSQLLGRVALRADQRLLSLIVVRHHVLEGIGDFKIIAEYFVVLDPQVLDAGTLLVLRLQIHQPLPALGLGFAELVNIGVEPRADDPAFLDLDGRLVLNGIRKELYQVVEVVHIVPQIL